MPSWSCSPTPTGSRGRSSPQTTTFTKAALREVLTTGRDDYRVLAKDRSLIRRAKRSGIRWEEDTTDRAADPSNRRRGRRRR